MIRFLLPLAASFLLSGCATSAASDTRPSALESLLEADRSFSAAAASATTPADALAPMFDAEVVMPMRARGNVSGREAVLAAMRDTPLFREGNLQWTPIRAGISADGTHGFTFGYLTQNGGDPARRDRKYLSYWIHRPEGWRVAAYRQAPRGAGNVSFTALPPSLPSFIARPTADPAVIAEHQRTLAAAELAFSDRAQQVGLHAAFREFGRPDAMNMGQAAAFELGVDQIIAKFPEAVTTSHLRWRTERAIVASSGDLGVSIGTITLNRQAEEGQPQSVPFFTIWRRDRPGAPWRYIAE